MSCIKVYGIESQPEKSILKRDLTSKYGEERADFLYNNVIHNYESDTSFMKYISSIDDIPVDINGEPTIEVVEDWIAKLEHHSKVNKKFKTNTFETTTEEFISLTEGFSVYLIESIYAKGNLTPNDLFQSKIANENNIFNNALNKVIQDLEDFKKDKDSDTERINEIINAINTDKKHFYNSFNSYIYSNLNFKLDVESILSDEIENNENKETKDSAFDKSSFEFDTKDGAPKSIKILIAGLPKLSNEGTFIPNELGLPQAVNYNTTFNYIQQKLVDIPADINEMLRELNDTGKPELQLLVKRMNFGKSKYVPSSDKITYDREQLIRTQFVTQFDKAQNEFTLHIKDRDGNIKMVDANLDKTSDIVLRQWQNVFEQKLQENPDLFEDLEDYKMQGKKAILDFLGIEMKDASKVPSTIVNEIVAFGLKSKEDFNNLYKPLKGEGVKSKLKKLAEMKALDAEEIVDFQHFNAEGKLVYGITLNTYLSSVAKRMRNNSGNKFAEEFPEIIENPYSSNSLWVDKIMEGELIKIGIFDGFKSEVDNDASPSKSLNVRDLNMQRLIGILKEGKYPFLRSADRGTENYFYFEGDRNLLVTDIPSAKRYLLKHLKSEIDTMNQDLDVINYKENNKDFRVFHINENGKKKSLLDKISLEELTELESLSSNKIVNDFVDTLIKQIIQEEKDALYDAGLFDKTNQGYHYVNDLIESFGNEDNVVSLFALNSFVANIEQTKLFTGDLAMYSTASDVFKRMSMLNSTKENARVDSELNNYIDKLEHRFEEKLGYTRRTTNSSIKTITINDVISDAKSYSEEFDSLLKKLFKEDYERYSSEYNKMNEADAQAYMTYDEYRIAMIRFGEWFPQDEKLYQDIADGKLEMQQEVIRRATVKKFQYTGKLTNFESNNVIAGRKFSVIPLIPSALEPNSSLSKLNKTMLRNGVGMAFFTSAAKFGHGTQTYDMYDADGKFNINLDESSYYDILDYKYMGNQLKIHNDPKDKVTASTQKRKIVKTNLYQNGELVDETLRELLDKYDFIQEMIVNKDFNAILKRLDVALDESNPKLKEDKSKFVNMLVDMGLSQGYTPNELMSLDFLKEVPYIDVLANRQKIENLIMAKLKNETISSKRKGDSVAQVSDVGFEIDINDAIEENANRHNLQFYREAKDGRLLPMEIMIALPEELIAYVKDVYGEGKFNHNALEKFNEAIAEANKVYEEGGKMTITQENLNKITTYVGFRIPNQAASSSDVAKVKKFMPPYMGASVVVPKPIVAKTGSDFDIDKLTLYKPHVKLIYENAYDIASNTLNESNVKHKQLRNSLLAEFDNVPNTYPELRKMFINEVLLVDHASLKDPDLSEYSRNFKNDLKKVNAKVKYIQYVKPNAMKSRGQIENALLETEIGITLHPANHRQLLAPLTATIIKDIVKDIRNLRGETNVEDHISDVFKNHKNIEKFVAFLSGKGGVGQVAVHITNHVLAQQAGLKMKPLHNYFGLGKASPIIYDIIEAIPEGTTIYNEDGTPYHFHGIRKKSLGRGGIRIKPLNGDEMKIAGANAKFYLSNPKNEGLIDLGRINNNVGQNISEILSEMLTSYVDIAKDPYILDLNALQSTANTILMMLRWGMDPKTVFYFVNQPIIREYVKQQSLNESVITDKDTGKLTKDALVAKVLKDYNIPAKMENMIYYNEKEIDNGNEKAVRLGRIYDPFTVEELKEGIKTGKPKSTKQKNVQLKSLDLFLEYQRQSTIFQNMIRSTSPDTQSFKSFTLLESQLNARAEVIESGMFENYDKMFTNFIKSYQDAKMKYKSLIQDLFITQHPMYKQEIDGMKELLTSKVKGQSAKEKLLFKIDNDFIRFILAKTGKINYAKGFNNLFKGDKSIPKTIMGIKKDFDEIGYANYFIDEMLPVIQDDFDNLRFKNKKLNNNEKQLLVDSIKWFKENEDYVEEEFGVKNFYNALIAYQMIQTGINNSPYNFLDAIPSEDYFNFVRSSIEQASNGTIDVADFTEISPDYVGDFLLNNPGILYKKYGLPVTVSYNRNSKKYSVNLKDVSVEQVGYGVRASLYNVYSQRVIPRAAGFGESRYVKELTKGNNKLNEEC